MTPPVEVRIDALVLHGFEPSERHRIAAIVERELALRFSEHGVPAALRHARDLPRLRGRDIRIGAPERVGTGIADALYRSLGGVVPRGRARAAQAGPARSLSAARATGPSATDHATGEPTPEPRSGPR